MAASAYSLPDPTSEAEVESCLLQEDAYFFCRLRSVTEIFLVLATMVFKKYLNWLLKHQPRKGLDDNSSNNSLG